MEYTIIWNPLPPTTTSLPVETFHRVKRLPKNSRGKEMTQAKKSTLDDMMEGGCLFGNR